MFAIINVSYFAYGAWFAVIKVSHAATSVACPWPYPEAKVYDPQGFYEKAGAQGPYSVGIWSTWASGEPNGRPHVDPPPPGQGALRTREDEWLSRAPLSSPVRPAGWGSHRPCACIARGGAWSRPCGHPTAGIPLLREATGAGEDDDRLIGVQLDLTGPRVDHRGRQGNRRSRRRTRMRSCTTRGSPPPEWWRRPIWRCGRGCSPPASWVPSR